MHVRQSFKWQPHSWYVVQLVEQIQVLIALACGHFGGIQIVPTNAHVRDVMTANDQAECTVALKHHVVVIS